MSPPLEWQDVPAQAKSLVLLVDDPDAPDPKRPRPTPFVHWILYDMPPDVAGLSEAVTRERLPPGAQVGINDVREHDWTRPCPPIGRHRYFFRLYALDVMLGKLPHGTRAELEQAMNGRVIAKAELIGMCRSRR